MELTYITVFCGSSSGNNPDYYAAAYQLGSYLAKSDIGLVYGGAKVGLMGAVASGVLDNKGTAIGVIPQFLKAVEIAHEQLSELIVVDTMHQRKAKMDELSDAVIALPGGFGTLEELFEMLTWGQLGLHKKPVGLLNTNGFYDDLAALTNKMVTDGFLKQQNQDMLLIDKSITGLMNKISCYEPPLTGKWLNIQDVPLSGKM